MRDSPFSLAAALLLVASCAGAENGVDEGSTPEALPTEAATTCADGCTLDRRSVCADGKPTTTCSDPLSCFRGACVAPCAAASAYDDTAGCSFYSAVPDSTSQGACFALVLANASTVPAKVAIEYDGIGVDVRRVLRAPRGSGPTVTYAALESPEIAPGEVAIAFVADSAKDGSACPAEIGGAGILADVAVHGPGIGKAFHVRTSVPVSAHAVFPFGGGTKGLGTATLLYPEHAWTTSAEAIELNLPYGTGPNLQLVSPRDANIVSMTPLDAIHGGGSVISTSPAKQVLTYKPNTGDFIQFSQPGQFSLTGSKIEGSFPVGIFAGSACPNSGVAACDPLFQQIPPLGHLGREYVAARHRNRFADVDERTPWHLVGAVDGTVLSYEPAAPEGAPTSLMAGQIIQFRSSTPFVVRSQDVEHPFYAAVMMESCAVYGTDDDCRGDPEMTTLVPTSRFGLNASFFADPSYPETNLVVVRAADAASTFHDVDLDCLGKIDGWEPIGSRFQLARVDLSRGNFDAQGACSTGAHTLKSDGAFTATVWGWGSAATRLAGGANTESASYALPIIAERRLDATSSPGAVR